MAEEFERYQKAIPIDHNIYLEGEDEYYSIENRETFNITKEYSSLSSGTSLGKTEETVIEPQDDTVYQTWIGIKHDIKLSIWQPASTKGLGTDGDPDGFITQEMSPYNAPNRDYTLVIPPEEKLYLDMENVAEVSFKPDLRYTGNKYKVTKLPSKPTAFLRLPTEAFGG